MPCALALLLITQPQVTQASALFTGSVQHLTLPAGLPADGSRLWIALDADPAFGSTVIRPVPNQQKVSDSPRVFLPFQADLLLCVQDRRIESAFRYTAFRWNPVSSDAYSIDGNSEQLTLHFKGSSLPVQAVNWFAQSATGELAQDQPYRTRMGHDFHLARYYQATGNPESPLAARGRFGKPGAKPRIYQLLPRLFGNASEQRNINGTLAENGTGKFSDLNAAVLSKLSQQGFTHIWVTGVLQQATSTDYAAAGQPADDPDLLKGIAGSPYAIKDYFDVSPDYADVPEKRLAEFKALASRMEAAGLKLIIDFVPNHVARSYDSDIRPELSFGSQDDTSVFFHPDNNFFYLTREVTDGAAPLKLPTVDHATGKIINETARLAGGADGLFEPERQFGKVTGNDVVSWTPSNGDWYETVKLNYGFNFLQRDAQPNYPTAITPDASMPDTWHKMDAIIAYWQELGVDGFRVDMAHMVPPEFWKWMIHRARERDHSVLFMAEAYDDDPAKVPGYDPLLKPEDGVKVALLDGGFHAVYDDPSYDTLMEIYEQGKWANDLDGVQQDLGPFFFDCAVRYSENHDEVRLAHPQTWGGNGMEVGPPVTALLFALSRGPVMIYHGQMAGEPALGREGFGGDDRRTTIFDYWSMPEFNKWWNGGKIDGGRLSDSQQALYEFYGSLLRAQSHPALADGNTYLLNQTNLKNEHFGRIGDIDVSGHWFYAFLRHDPDSGAAILVTTNLHATETAQDVRVKLSPQALTALNIGEKDHDRYFNMRDLLSADKYGKLPRGSRIGDALQDGIMLGDLPPMSTQYWILENTQGSTRSF